MVWTREGRHLLNRLIRCKLVNCGICSGIGIISLKIATLVNEWISARGVLIYILCLTCPSMCTHITGKECLCIWWAWRYCSWLRHFHFVLFSKLMRTYLSCIIFGWANELIMSKNILFGCIVHHHWGLTACNNGILLLAEEVWLSLSGDNAIVSRTIVGSTWLTLSSHSLQRLNLF